MRALLLGVFALVAVVPASAQTPEIRYELGRRISAFEATWDYATKEQDTEARKRAIPIINQAVQSYFKLDFSAVAKSIDTARHTLHSKVPISAKWQWGQSLYVVPEARVVSASTKELNVTVKTLYKMDGVMPKMSVRLVFGFAKAEVFPLTELPATFKIKLNEVVGDEKLTAEILDADGKSLATNELGLSRIERLEERFKRLTADVEKLPMPRKTIEEATLAQHVKLLTSAQKNAQETNYPYTRLLAQAEALNANRVNYFDNRQSGEHWQCVPTGKTTTSIRIHVPKGLGATKVPVVIALHGMGGSENMFFDAYGQGIVPRLATDRGWLVVATRVEGLLGAGPAPNVPALLDELQKRYPIDTKNVFLIGHSMGAGHALSLVQQNPERYAAVVALGGGSKIAKADKVKAIPFFVGCGKLDFALTGAKGLAQSLEGGKVTFKEYDDIEHLVIVREAAPDVFKFLDEAKRK